MEFVAAREKPRTGNPQSRRRVVVPRDRIIDALMMLAAEERFENHPPADRRARGRFARRIPRAFRLEAVHSRGVRPGASIASFWKERRAIADENSKERLSTF